MVIVVSEHVKIQTKYKNITSHSIKIQLETVYSQRKYSGKMTTFKFKLYSDFLGI